VCLPSHASIKHSDSRGDACSHEFWLDLFVQGSNDRGSYLLGKRKGVEGTKFLAERGEVVLFVWREQVEGGTCDGRSWG
jgi:hypothetical protein